ncbi:unnamed protein product [Ectocarpus sp. 8 AP-2014]
MYLDAHSCVVALSGCRNLDLIDKSRCPDNGAMMTPDSVAMMTRLDNPPRPLHLASRFLEGDIKLCAVLSFRGPAPRTPHLPLSPSSTYFERLSSKMQTT